MDTLLSGFYSLGKNINKTTTGNTEEQAEGVISELVPELELSMSDEELITLKKDWISQWATVETELAESQKDNENYWLGKQYSDTSTKAHPLVDNLIFESLETFLPIATRPKADPVVTADNTEEGQKIADTVRKMLAKWGDDTAYNLKMKEVARYWSLYKLGCIKLGWSQQANDITCISVRPQKLILDPDSTIDCGKYTGEYIGEYRKESARNLAKRFPKSKSYIEGKCSKKWGTKMQYIEWWTDDILFWTMDDHVLGKTKNPHFNYETEQSRTDEMGQVTQEKVAGKNHFKFPQKPYAFLSVFSLGTRPFDDTNLIQQSLPLQDLINKRLRQIDKNADTMANGALAISGDSFTKEQASGVANARKKGGTLYVPTGDVNRAVVSLPGQPLPNFVYESLVDYRNELRNIFGVRGSTAQGTIQDKTVRGKMQIKGQDSDRIGGGISTYLEELSDVVYNYVVQMMYVYYDEEHIKTIIGKNRTEEYIKLKSSDLTCALTVSVKDGSMIPKDPVTSREEVMELWAQGAVDPITFFEKLDFANPRESAMQLYLWKADPIQLFPELAQAQAEQAPQPDPAQEAQAAKLQSQMQLEQQKGQADLMLKKQQGEIEQQKGVESILNMQEKHELEMEKQRQAIQLQRESARQKQVLQAKAQSKPANKSK